MTNIFNQGKPMKTLSVFLFMLLCCFSTLQGKELLQPYSYEIKKVENEYVAYGYYSGFFTATTVKGSHYGQQGFFTYKGKVLISNNNHVNTHVDGQPYIMNKYPDGMVVYTGKSNQVIFVP
jgi:hypothetical protein